MEEKKEKTNKTEGDSRIAFKVLVEPWVTEASTRALELNKYVFKVGQDAGKKQVKQSIEDLYKVKVISVNTVNIPRKKQSYGRTPGWKSGYKKAIVTLKAGDSIELFKGV